MPRTVRTPVSSNCRAALLAALIVFAAAPLHRAGAQQGDEAEVVALAQKMFDGMRTRDTSLIRSVFDPAARLIGVTRQGAVKVDTPDDFIRAVAGAKDGPAWNERMWDTEVRIDGNIAQLWAKYDFHLGEKFSHCGVDAFQFAKTAGGWKIIQVADTRRSTGCTPPPAR
jgi:hypothetical protein